MPTDADHPENFDHPLIAAVSCRDRVTVAMVGHALRDRRVALAFQPVVFAADPGRVAFYEGLIRLVDESGQIIPAAMFMPAIEATHAGRQIDCAALSRGLEALQADPALRLAINMSARSIGSVQWMQTLAAGLARDETVAERLILEITETSAMLAPERVATFMHGLQRLGIAFALDDFGAGNTSFRHFRDFSFDMVKIDRQFTANVHRDPDNQVLVQALTMIARRFELLLVAEGVELAEDAAWLREQGVDCLQGYLFGAPAIAAGLGSPHARRRA